MENTIKNTAPVNIEKDILASFFEILLKNDSKKLAMESSLQQIVSLGWLPVKSMSGIFLVDEKNSNQLRLYVTTKNFSKKLLVICDRVNFGHCICGRAAATKKIQFVDCIDEKHETRFDGMKPHGHYSVPFFDSKQTLLGVLVLYVDHGHKSTQSEVSFLESVALGLGSICEKLDKEEAYNQQKNILLQQTSEDLFKYKQSLDIAALVSETCVDGIITYVNDKFCEISKYSRQELIGQTHRIVNSDRHSKDFWKQCWDTIKQGKIWKGEVINRAKDDSIYWVETTIVPNSDTAGNVIGYSTIKVDITDKKDTEKQLIHSSKLATIGEMAAGVGHEINNPLAISVGNLSIVERLLQDEKVVNRSIYDRLEKVKKSHERIRKIVDGLRTYARSDVEHTETFSVNEAIDQTANLISELYQQEGILLIKEHANEEILATGSLGKMQQIILNLVSNAKDATEGQDERVVHLSLKKKGIDQSILTVTDNGIGIPENIRNKILRPFFTTKEAGIGTGIGLGLVNNFIKKMQGELIIETEVGKGTSFSVVLPLANKDVTTGTMTDEALPKIRSPLKGTVLIIDDEPCIRELLAMYLTNMGLQVEEADDGDTALTKVKTKCYDLICTDMKMPRMRGEVFISKAKEHPNGDTQYLIITGGVTTNYSKKKRAELWELADGYITKPFNEQSLYKVIVDIMTDRKCEKNTDKPISGSTLNGSSNKIDKAVS